MVLDILNTAPFAAHLHKTITVEAAEGELAVELVGIVEQPLAAGPNAKRTPFNVMLCGPESPCLADGCYHLRAEGPEGWRLENIYLNRIIAPASSDGTGAYYQVVFG